MAHRGEPDSEEVQLTFAADNGPIEFKKDKDETEPFHPFDDWSPCENREDPSSWDDPDIDTEPYRES